MKNNSVDFVQKTFFVLHLIENKTQFIKSIFNNLKSGGYCFINTVDITDQGQDIKIFSQRLSACTMTELATSIGIKFFK